MRLSLATDTLSRREELQRRVKSSSQGFRTTKRNAGGKQSQRGKKKQFFWEKKTELWEKKDSSVSRVIN